MGNQTMSDAAAPGLPDAAGWGPRRQGMQEQDPRATTRRLAVLAAGVHDPSTSRALATALAEATVRAGSGQQFRTIVTDVEIRDYAVDLANATVAGVTSSRLSGVIADVTGADGVVAVTPTFASSYAGLFKTFFDVLDPAALVGMPTLLGATGGSVRHSLIIEGSLRPLLGYFRAAVVPTGVFATPAELAGGAGTEELTDRIGRAGVELAAMMGSADRSRSGTSGERA